MAVFLPAGTFSHTRQRIVRPKIAPKTRLVELERPRRLFKKAMYLVKPSLRGEAAFQLFCARVFYCPGHLETKHVVVVVVVVVVFVAVVAVERREANAQFCTNSSESLARSRFFEEGLRRPP